ncbi:MAG TPA: alkaline phosphatase [Porphyromonadaceae bacterium]|jgi:alkaline phosphatase|nr:alkaline phosphatase [Porphyromonadaceae bacterium]
MRRNLILSVFFTLFISVFSIFGQAKYVFYFIGDGMGVDVVNLTETYLSDVNGERGSVSLLMTQFPVATFATTFSANADVTDSAASGTALATGKKATNGTLGLDLEGDPIETIAEKAKKAGKKVGIATTVTINHATPAAFYAHQNSRNMGYEISHDLLASGFDFFAGAGFFDAKDIYTLVEDAGYTVSKGFNDFRANARNSDKVILVHEEKSGGIPYYIDRTEQDLSLKQITEAAIDVLTRDNKKGFFLMLEGGKIDGGGHGNDGATMIKEVIDMDEAIQVAFDFYKKHPKETLIVITADHDTGGISYTGNNKIQNLQYQQYSQNELSARMNKLMEEKNNKVFWEDIKALLSETMGLWKEVPVSWKYERILRDTYENTIAKNKDDKDVNLYAENKLMAAKAKEVLNSISGLGWATGGHTNGYVPVFVIGKGQESFTHKMDNVDIPLKIIEAAKY